MSIVAPNSWMDEELKMPLITEVDLSPGHIVLDGNPALPRKGHSSPPPLRSMSIVATVAHLFWC